MPRSRPVSRLVSRSPTNDPPPVGAPSCAQNSPCGELSIPLRGDDLNAAGGYLVSRARAAGKGTRPSAWTVGSWAIGAGPDNKDRDHGVKNETALIAGALFITATVASLLSTVFLNPVLNKADYLTKIAANENRVITGALFLLIGAFASASIAISLYPVLTTIQRRACSRSCRFQAHRGSAVRRRCRQRALAGDVEPGLHQSWLSVSIFFPGLGRGVTGSP